MYFADDIKKTYKKLALKHHPDKVSALIPWITWWTLLNQGCRLTFSLPMSSKQMTEHLKYVVNEPI